MFHTHWGWIWAHETLELLLGDITYIGAPHHSLCHVVLHFFLHRMPHHINSPALTSDYLPVCKPVKCGITVVVPNFLECEDLFLNSINFTETNTILTVLSVSGDRGSTVANVLCYKSEGHWFNPSWCHWIFHRHKILPIALWLWGQLSL